MIGLVRFQVRYNCCDYDEFFEYNGNWEWDTLQAAELVFDYACLHSTDLGDDLQTISLTKCVVDDYNENDDFEILKIFNP